MSTFLYLPIPVLESDLPTAARFMYYSQIQQATNRFLFLDWPNEVAQMELYNASMRDMFQDDMFEMYKINNDLGEMIASLILTRKTSNEEEAAASKTQQRPTGPPRGINLTARPIMGRAMANVLQPMEDKDHLVLSTIYVEPQARSQGIGKQLVEFCIKRANIEQLPLFLCSVPLAVEFYRKLGFRDTSYSDIDLGQWTPPNAGFGIYRLQGMLLGPE